MGETAAERQEWLLDLALCLGLRVTTAAEVAAVSVERAWYAWSRRTGLPTPSDPTPSVVRARALEVQRGWTPQARELASRGITHREQSAVVSEKVEALRERNRREWQRRRERRATANAVEVGP